MSYSGYRSKWEDEEQLSPLKLVRTKIVVELEVYATVTDYNAHQITLSHPDMDGSLTFDVANLQEAEDTLDQLEGDAEEEDEVVVPEPKRIEPKVEPKWEPPRAWKPEPPVKEFIAQPPPPQTPSKPQPQVQQPQPVRRPEVDPETNPFGSLVSDVGEICDLIGKLTPRVGKFFKKK